jgi:hypothetical protein
MLKKHLIYPLELSDKLYMGNLTMFIYPLSVMFTEKRDAVSSDRNIWPRTKDASGQTTVLVPYTVNNLGRQQ